MVQYSAIESDFASCQQEAAYDAGFRAKVERSLQSTAPHNAHGAVVIISVFQARQQYPCSILLPFPAAPIDLQN